MRRLPPLNALRAFEAAGRHLNLGEAAKELFVTHGAVSKQVKSLETLLGVELTRRTRTGLVLTPEGQRLMPHLTDAMDSLASAVRNIETNEFSGQANVACMPAFTVNWLIPKLGSFSARYPDITINIIPAHGNDPLVDASVDFAILYGRPMWPSRNVQRLSQLELFPVCSPKLLNGPNKIRQPSDLPGHLLVDDIEGTHWREWSAVHGLRLQNTTRTLRFRDFNHCISAARNGLGITMGDNITTATDLLNGTLVRPLREVLQPETKAYYLVTSLTNAISPAAQVFMDWISEEISRTSEISANK